MCKENIRLKKKLENKNRRQSMSIKVYEFKLTKLSLSDKKYLDKIFLETKWYYNYILSQEDILNFDTKIKNIIKKDKEGNDIEVEVSLSAKIRQSIKFRIRDAIKGLSVKKKKGRQDEVGKLKFKSKINSVELNQYKSKNSTAGTHKYNFTNNTITFNKHTFKLLGLKQIKENVEFANAFLIRKADGYYIHQTCYCLPEKLEEREESVGTDFGVKDNITLSNGEKFNSKIEEPLRLKNLQRKLCRQVKGSKNYYKTKNKIDREYLKNNNKKNDSANKIFSYLNHNFKKIVIQDENLKGWHSGLFGKQVQCSILGRLKSKLISLKKTIVVDKFFPSTKQCYVCGHKNNIELSERIFKCQHCGFEEDRDVKAAKTILFEGLRLKNSSSCGTQDNKCGENVSLLEMTKCLVQEAIFCEA